MAPADALADATIWLDDWPHVVVPTAHLQPPDWYEEQLRLVRRSLHHDDGVDAILHACRYETPEARVLHQCANWPIRAARESAVTIRCTRSTAEAKADAWHHLAEVAQDLGIKNGPPRSIVCTTPLDRLARVEPFLAADVVRAMIGELLSNRLDNLDWFLPRAGLRRYVDIERVRYYGDALSNQRKANKRNTVVPPCRK